MAPSMSGVEMSVPSRPCVCTNSCHSKVTVSLQREPLRACCPRACLRGVHLLWWLHLAGGWYILHHFPDLRLHVVFPLIHNLVST